MSQDDPSVPAPALPVSPSPPLLPLGLPFADVLLDAAHRPERRPVEALLPGYLKRQRWFGFKDQPIREAAIREAMRVPGEAMHAYLVILQIELPERPEFYLMPLALARGDEADRLLQDHPRAPLAWIEEPDRPERRLLHDAAANPAFWHALLGWWQSGTTIGSPLTASRYVPRLDAEARAATVQRVRVFSGEQSNSSAVYDDRFYAKLYRRLEQGIHPEPELLEHLTQVGFRYAPRLYGTLVLERPERTLALGILQQAVPVETDGWTYARAMTTRFLGRLPAADAPSRPPLLHHHDDPVPAWLDAAGAEMLALARLLGRRTAELHRALSAADAPDLRPRPGSPERTRAFVAGVRKELAQTRRSLEGHAGALPTDDAWQHGMACLERLADAGAQCPCIRVHGDYHLGQVVRSEGEFYLLDFEGEPTRSIEERRACDCNLRDVAGMLRSIEYAVLSAAREYLAEAPTGGAAYSLVAWCRVQFLQSYFATAGAAAFLPPPATRRRYLWAYLFYKALYEVRYELSHRPDWTWLPLRGLHRLLGEAAALNDTEPS